MHHVHKTKGFTLIELMLAMSFIAVLLLAIALTIIQISNVYNHGLTLRDVNQAGASISNDLQQTVSQSTPFSVDGGSGSRLVTEKTSGVVTGGRLCLGKYSYIWNLGAALEDNAPSLNVYSGSSKPIYFARVVDPSANYCLSATSSKYAKIAVADSADLLTQGDHSLVMQSFNISTSTLGKNTHTTEQLYSINFTLGTNDQASLMKDADGNLACRPPTDPGADPTYCAISSFDIVVRAGNSVQ